MAWAPEPRSSAGWKRVISVPDQRARLERRVCVAARAHVTCMSWPQASADWVSVDYMRT